MARRKNKPKRRSRQPTKTKPPQTAALATSAGDTPEQAVDKIKSAAMSTATEADVEAAAETPAPKPGASAEDLIEKAAEALALLDAQKKRVDAVEAEVSKKGIALDEERQTLGTLQAELEEKEKSLTQREEQIKERDADILQRQEDIVRRELDADVGFSQRNRAALAKLEAESEGLSSQLSHNREKITQERADFEEELKGRRDELAEELTTLRKTAETEIRMARDTLDRELTEVRAGVEKEREEFQAEATRLRGEARDLAVDRDLLDEDRAALDKKVAQRAARAIELKDGKISALTERLAAAREERDRLSQQLVAREEANRRFGEETPEQIMQRLRALEGERDKLKEALGGRPSAEAAQRLEELQRQEELWESDQLQLKSELAEARNDAARKRIAVTELESLRDVKRSFESANALLHEANVQLRVEVDALVKGAEGKSPFPSCSAMDTSNKLQATRPMIDTIKSLSKFADYVRQRMAWDPITKKELYYSAEDVRSFLGGLAMSRLHLLQGISGTGKTSLPLAFARAIGAGSALVEVQAGWRDRQDLLGHFNTFERRFYESEFLQAMYRASCPAYKDAPFIIVLDEMNLSHPEQYFADLLSALEQDQHHQRVVLMTAGVDPAPHLLIDRGTKLPIPPNVWFVGTANHDETTKDFADKTYDRSHVMELPRNRVKFKRKECQPENPVSLVALKGAFDDAVKKHLPDADKAYGFLQANLGEMLGQRFHVGWGNRLERQMTYYVPVVVAAGGSVGEATDHILATKLLRKVRDRHDNRPEDIIALRDQIKNEWCQFDEKAEPVRSLALLHDELHRLGHDDD